MKHLLILILLLSSCKKDTDPVCYDCITTEVIEAPGPSYPRTTVTSEVICIDKSGQTIEVVNRDGIVATKTTTVICHKK